jgi:hypothetical protein
VLKKNQPLARRTQGPYRMPKGMDYTKLLLECANRGLLDPFSKLVESGKLPQKCTDDAFLLAAEVGQLKVTILCSSEPTRCTSTNSFFEYPCVPQTTADPDIPHRQGFLCDVLQHAWREHSPPRRSQWTNGSGRNSLAGEILRENEEAIYTTLM